VLYELNALTVLITDGISTTDGTPAADVIKKAGNPLFAIGIDANNNLVHLESLSSTGDNGIKHFFHITSYEALENIGKYLNRK
jgi:CO dehydrogenase/acetyl-CoA synthase epsilon subunit